MAKRFIKAEMWLLLYIIVQCAIMFAVMVYRVNSDVAYADGIMKALTDTTVESGENIGFIARSINMAQTISAYLSSVLIPTCIISAAVVMAVYMMVRWRTLNGQSISWQNTIKYVVYALVANFFITVIVEMLPKTLIYNHTTTTNIALSGNFFMVLLSTGVLVPVMEEIIFRYGIGETIGGRVGLIYQAVVFGLLHGNIIQIIYAFGLGLWFGMENARKGSLLPGIVMHITFNASTVIASALY